MTLLNERSEITVNHGTPQSRIKYPRREQRLRQLLDASLVVSLITGFFYMLGYLDDYWFCRYFDLPFDQFGSTAEQRLIEGFFTAMSLPFDWRFAWVIVLVAVTIRASRQLRRDNPASSWIPKPRVRTALRWSLNAMVLCEAIAALEYAAGAAGQRGWNKADEANTLGAKVAMLRLRDEPVAQVKVIRESGDGLAFIRTERTDQQPPYFNLISVINKSEVLEMTILQRGTPRKPAPCWDFVLIAWCSEDDSSD